MHPLFLCTEDSACKFSGSIEVLAVTLIQI